MLAGAGAGECGGDTDDVAVARLELLGEVDLVTGRVLDQDVEVGDLLADANHSSRGRVEAACDGGGPSEGDAAERSSEGHFVKVN